MTIVLFGLQVLLLKSKLALVSYSSIFLWRTLNRVTLDVLGPMAADTFLATIWSHLFRLLMFLVNRVPTTWRIFCLNEWLHDINRCFIRHCFGLKIIGNIRLQVDCGFTYLFNFFLLNHNLLIHLCFYCVWCLFVIPIDWRNALITLYVKVNKTMVVLTARLFLYTCSQSFMVCSLLNFWAFITFKLIPLCLWVKLFLYAIMDFDITFVLLLHLVD